MTEPDAPSPAIRASDAEREAVVSRLRAVATEGRLTLDELAERLERALSATTRAELEPLTADLPAPTAAPVAPPAGVRRVVAIMGGNDHRGRWRIASRCTVINVMGGADLDLTDAIVEGPVTEIVVFSLMGGSDIFVPDGVHVELGGFALMGGNDLELEDAPAPPLDAPVIHVRAYSLMGGTDVKRSKRARRRLRGG
jgi:Domain of unknown function (DUF1707)/Cell wall-active antibiotics response 4TMS YvqF